jgi:hypothetical protein
MRAVLVILLFLFFRTGFSQKILDIHYNSLFGKNKSFQIFNNSKLDYKLKGDLLYKQRKLVNMNDSMLIFDDDSVIKLSQLKCIKIRGSRFSHWVFTSGILFFMIDTGNNIVNGHTKIVNEQTVLISTVGIIAGIIVRRIEDKHIYVRKNVTLKVLDTSYENLNAALR